MTLDNRQLQALESLGEFLLVHDRREDAQAVFEGLVTIAPARPYGWYGLAQLAERAGSLERAIAAWTEAVQRSNDPELHLQHAEFLLRSGHIAEATSALRGLANHSGAIGERAAAILRHRLGQVTGNRPQDRANSDG